MTSAKVFRVLQTYRHRAYYLHKYEITNRLRGTPEYDLPAHDVDMIKKTYKRYNRHMHDYQEEHDLGSKNSRGRRRVFWPTRFMFVKILIIIGREDLVGFLRGVRGQKREQEYEKHWAQLVEYVDKRDRPIDRHNRYTQSTSSTRGRLRRL